MIFSAIFCARWIRFVVRVFIAAWPSAPNANEVLPFFSSLDEVCSQEQADQFGFVYCHGVLSLVSQVVM